MKKTNGQVDDKNSPDSEYVEDLEQMKQAHLLNGEEKSKIYKTYLTNRYKNMSTQLTNDKGEEMSKAEYNALRRPYSESKNHR